MADFQKTFEDFIAMDPGANVGNGANTPTSWLAKPDTSKGDRGMRSLLTGGLSQGDDERLTYDPLQAFDAMAIECVEDTEGAERALDKLHARAATESNVVLAALSTFGEVLRGVVFRFRSLPTRLAGVLQKFREVVAAVAKAFEVITYSLTINLPWSISFGFSWDPNAK